MISDIDRWSGLDSPIHRQDPRWRIAGLGILLVTMAIDRSPESQDARLAPILGCLLVSIVLVAMSRLPIAWVLRSLRVPSFFLVFLLLTLPWRLAADGGLGTLHWSPERAQLAVRIVLRALAMLLVALPLVATSTFANNLKALRHLHVPRPIVELLFVTYRYIFGLRAQSDRLSAALRARGFRQRADLRTLRTLGGSLGVLLVHNIERMRRVRDAMRCRNDGGAFRTLDTFHTTPRDIVLFLAIVSVGVLLLVWRLL